MFFAHIDIAEKYDYLAGNFRKAYQWLSDTDIASLDAGSYPIEGDDVVANVQVYKTFMPTEGLFESHEKYFDIQYLVSGVESFGICKTAGLTEERREPELDLIFYKEPELSGAVILHPGDFIVVAPEDAHKPRCAAGAPCNVKKVVVKVRI